MGTGSSAAGRAGAPLTTCEIVDAIETTAPVLRESFPGRITYVLKDRETDSAADAARAREILRAAGRRAGVSVAVVEKGSAPPPRPDAGQKHAALGRDDFYIALLAREYGCPVLSRDRFRDLRDMKSGHLPPFRVYLYTPHARRGAPPERTYVTPAAPEYGGLRRPRVLDFSRYLPWWSK